MIHFYVIPYRSPPFIKITELCLQYYKKNYITQKHAISVTLANCNEQPINIDKNNILNGCMRSL